MAAVAAHPDDRLALMMACPATDHAVVSPESSLMAAISCRAQDVRAAAASTSRSRGGSGPSGRRPRMRDHGWSARAQQIPLTLGVDLLVGEP